MISRQAEDPADRGQLIDQPRRFTPSAISRPDLRVPLRVVDGHTAFKATSALASPGDSASKQPPVVVISRHPAIMATNVEAPSSAGDVAAHGLV